MTKPVAAPEIFQIPFDQIDTASFVVETRYGVWGAQAPLKPKGYSKKKRTFGPVALQFMDGVEGRFVGLLPEAEKQNLH